MVRSNQKFHPEDDQNCFSNIGSENRGISPNLSKPTDTHHHSAKITRCVLLIFQIFPEATSVGLISLKLPLVHILIPDTLIEKNWRPIDQNPSHSNIDVSFRRLQVRSS
jgi:hypothetical protein